MTTELSHAAKGHIRAVIYTTCSMLWTLKLGQLVYSMLYPTCVPLLHVCTRKTQERLNTKTNLKQDPPGSSKTTLKFTSLHSICVSNYSQLESDIR